jgi:acetoin utilization deacetylase AcuC-like enzyme
VLNVPLEPLWVRASRVASAPRGRLGFRAAVTEKLLPRLRDFAPELLLISAGFDGAVGDDGNAQDDVGGLDLTDDDFRWVTTRLCAAVGPDCSVVSVLEGGYGTFDEERGAYDRKTLASGAAAHVSALCAHARALQQR